MKYTVLAGLSVMALMVAVTVVSNAYATGGPPPPPADQVCRPYVEQPSDAHTLTLDKSNVLPGENITATASVTAAGTGVNRIRFVWIDDQTNTVVQENLYTRGNDNPSSWSRSDTFIVPSSAQPGDSFTVVACFESPNNTNAIGVTRHVNVGSFMVVPESILGALALTGAGFATFYAYSRRK
jgi:hypothetical protein